ncbi:MAG: BON domain-containing protein [Vicinamibacterales bacterium]
MTTTLRALLVCLGVLAAVTTAPGCAPAVSALRIEAAHAEARVKTALVNDPDIGTRVINVRMLGTVAQLTGRVESQAEAARAVALARAVGGVTGVDNRLQIGDATPTADATDLAVDADPTRGPAFEMAELEERYGLVALGAGVGWSNQPAPASGTRTALQPLITLGSGPGARPVVVFDWFGTTTAESPDAPLDAGRTTIRPVLAGFGYTVALGRLQATPSFSVGYAFNSLHVPDQGVAQGVPVEVANSVAWRPGLAVSIDTTRRTAITLSLGRVFTRPRVTFIDDGILSRRSVNTDTTVFLAGFVYRLF